MQISIKLVNITQYYLKVFKYLKNGIKKFIYLATSDCINRK